MKKIHTCVLSSKGNSWIENDFRSREYYHMKKAHGGKNC